MREGLRSWLTQGNVGADDAAEAVLATWEACANAVEHAQSPSESSFRLVARLDDAGRMRIQVRDSGQWKPGDGTAERGLGLGLMRSLMDTVQVSPSDDGTEVVLERNVRHPQSGLAATWKGVGRQHMHRPYSASEAHRLLVDSRPVGGRCRRRTAAWRGRPAHGAHPS